VILGHRIEELSRIFHHAPCYIEILSIITAVRHLPRYTERDPERVAERQRERGNQEGLQALMLSVERWPLLSTRMSAFNGSVGDAPSFNLLDNLLSQQVYRLAFWRVARTR
jgi:(1->4)-alpha-D-glucan 1-alpha-D-glucosylmutase